MKLWQKLIIIIILCCVSVYAGFQIYNILISRKEANDIYDSAMQHVSINVNINNIEPTDETDVTLPSVPQDIDEQVKIDRYIDVDFSALEETNSDFFGWLYLINDNIINYPVVQGSDNSYYLKHTFDKKYNSHGTLFIDYRNNIDEFNDNSIIYGHTMQSATMFNSLGKFKKQDYYEEHPYFLLETPDAEYKLEVFACYATPAISNAYIIDFNEVVNTFVDNNGNEQNFYKYDESIPVFEEWYDEVMSKNLIETNVVVEPVDKIFTMSACDYTFQNARVVVHCKVVKTGDFKN